MNVANDLAYLANTLRHAAHRFTDRTYAVVAHCANTASRSANCTKATHGATDRTADATYGATDRTADATYSAADCTADATYSAADTTHRAANRATETAYCMTDASDCSADCTTKATQPTTCLGCDSCQQRN
ncbi:hypothetical protein [Mesorhizobium sp. B4-1-1]|uniref:hypothetical protein n=1 Tax=Mesorhizobium sp. B4-1-1 TaxID=2589890 RepID=UPI0015E2FDA7|nr:hypothetical protein [Mesorhizobium sp. B4-1-1]